MFSEVFQFPVNVQGLQETCAVPPQVVGEGVVEEEGAGREEDCWKRECARCHRTGSKGGIIKALPMVTLAVASLRTQPTVLGHGTVT